MNTEPRLRKTDEEKKELIEKIQAKVVNEGVTLRNSCRFFGVHNVSQYYGWRSKLKKNALEEGKKDLDRVNPKSTPSFLTLNVNESSAPLMIIMGSTHDVNQALDKLISLRGTL